jgi:endothelin-converting enzyme/putative endopeptidase
VNIMRAQTFLFVSWLWPMATVLAVAQSGSAPAPRGTAAATTTAPADAAPQPSIEAASIDRQVAPCTDFYQFACGAWLAANPIPADRQRWGRFNQLQERNFAILRQLLEAPGAGADRQRAADFYAACMDEGRIEARGLAPLAANLAGIAAIARSEDLLPVVAALHRIGVNVLFRFGSETDLRDATREIAAIDQGGLGLPDRDYYLKTDARSVEIKRTYQQHVETMLALVRAGSARTAAAHGADWPATGAAAVVALETALAEASLDRTTRRDPAAVDHMMRVAEWQALTPHVHWRRYTTAAGAPSFDRLNVAVPAYLQALDRLVASTPIEDVKTYLTWQLVNARAEMLPHAFAEADFDFFSRTLGGQPQQLPRWQRCVTQTDRLLGEALGKAFVDAAFGPAAKADTLAMVRAIKDAMARDIDAADWMSDETKRAAHAKLAAVTDRIGYPDTWRDYSSVRISRTDALGNLQRATAFEERRDLAKIGRVVDRGEWLMTPPTVNAYYSADRNNINFPAGILQPPFYQAGRDAAVNYGGAGAVVGHELTHGFDDQGRKFDGQGNLHNWWTDADARAYEQRASCVADQYTEYVVAGDTHLNGKLTLGENTADNGGVRLALLAYLAGPGAAADAARGDDGFTPEQRFFVGFAQIWCENRRPEFERVRATTDPHASARYRVNGVVSNMPEFQKAFACAAGQPMVRANQCRVW